MSRVFVVYAKDDPACTRKFFNGDPKNIWEGTQYADKLGEKYGDLDVIYEGEFTDHLETFVAWLNKHAGEVK
jgi:hypothetical protein